MRIATKPALWCAGVAALAVTADVATKAWALARLSDGRVITLVGGSIRLQLVINHGAAFGLGARYESLLAVVAFASAILLGTWAMRAGSRAERFGAALATAGAAGNLINRLAQPPGVLHGGVVDWLHIWFYSPTFNLADIWLRAGVLIAVGSWFWRRRRKQKRPGRGRDAGDEPVEPLDDQTASLPRSPALAPASARTKPATAGPSRIASKVSLGQSATDAQCRERPGLAPTQDRRSLIEPFAAEPQ
jgi:signal peptidase II